MERENENGALPVAKSPEYEPPQVEGVMNADDLAREVHYAGTQASPGAPG